MKPKVIYTHNSLEFGKSCEKLSWNHCTSTSHRSETHGIAEGAVRRVKSGTSVVFSQYRSTSWCKSATPFEWVGPARRFRESGRAMVLHFWSTFHQCLSPIGKISKVSDRNCDLRNAMEFGDSVLISKVGALVGQGAAQIETFVGDVPMDYLSRSSMIASMIDETDAKRRCLEATAQST